MRKPSHTEVPTVDDLAAYGPAACLEALRAEYAEAHSRHPQYRGREATAQLGIIRQRIDKHGASFLRADAGDLVLTWTEPATWLGGGDVVAYCPRVGWNVGGLRYGVDPVPVG